MHYEKHVKNMVIWFSLFIVRIMEENSYDKYTGNNHHGQEHCGGAYVNFMMDEGEDRVKATYRDNYERLLAIKNTYDPTNLFRVNQNIKPTQ